MNLLIDRWYQLWPIDRSIEKVIERSTTPVTFLTQDVWNLAPNIWILALIFLFWLNISKSCLFHVMERGERRSRDLREVLESVSGKKFRPLLTSQLIDDFKRITKVKLSLVRTWFANVPLPVCDHSHGIYLDPNTGDRVKFFGLYSNEQTSKLTEKISTECTRWAWLWEHPNEKLLPVHYLWVFDFFSVAAGQPDQ